MRAPSVKTLLARLHWIDEKQAAAVRGLIKGEIEPDTILATAAWLRQCCNTPSRDQLVMHAIDAVTECYGVEAVWSEDTIGAPRFVYANTGDMYCPTVILDYRSATYKVQSVGDFVEINKL